MNTVYRHLRQKRWRSSLTIVASLVFLSFIIAPDEASAFCEDRNDGSTCHTHMVDQPLSFLRDELHDYLLDAVLFPDDSGFLGTDYSSADHFDSCNFAGGTKRINGRLRGLNQSLIAVPADHPFQGVAKWAAVLHASQDFYAHSNWLEMALAGAVPKAGLGGTELIDSGLGLWTEIDGSSFLVRSNVIHFNEDMPSGWSSSTTLGDKLPQVTSNDGQTYWVLISGESFNPFEDCPDDMDVDHDDLNKDNINRINHLEAQLVAIRQTKHEWCRLLHVALNEFDHRTASVPMGLWVEPGESPHIAGTVCAEKPPGNIDVTVSIDRIKVLNDHNTDGPGDLNFAFTLYTGDFRRSTRTQLPPLPVNTGAQVPGGDLPAPLSLCVDSTDQIVTTLQGWEDDGMPGKLSKDDDVLGGISRWIGFGVDVANETPFTLGSYTLTSDFPDVQDIEIDITISNQGVDSDGDGLTLCQELAAGLDPQVADTDGDGLNDGAEIALGSDPLDADSDNDGLTDGDEVNTYGSSPTNTDSDGDGLLDGDEVNTYGTDPSDSDSDDDSLTDGNEVITHGTDPNDDDSDDDGLTDGDEVNTYGTDPLVVDSDDDGLTDGDEVNTYGTDPLVEDTDDDGLSDGDEVNTHGTDPLDDDSDDDGLTDGDEVNTYGTDPLVADTDNDGLTDGDEVNTHGTDPLDEDSDDDGLNDGLEVDLGTTDPLNPDSDGDGLLDGHDVDFIQDALSALPDSAFKNRGQALELHNRLDAIENNLVNGQDGAALQQLTAFRKKIDGCGDAPQPDDAIVDCQAQVQVRELIDLLLANLS